MRQEAFMPLHVKTSALHKATHEVYIVDWKNVTIPEKHMALQHHCRDRTREPYGTSIPLQGPLQITIWHFNTTAGTAPENHMALQYHCRDRTREPVGTSISLQAQTST
jgi:hypothetical protein